MNKPWEITFHLRSGETVLYIDREWEGDPTPEKVLATYMTKEEEFPEGFYHIQTQGMNYTACIRESDVSMITVRRV